MRACFQAGLHASARLHGWNLPMYEEPEGSVETLCGESITRRPVTLEAGCGSE